MEQPFTLSFFNFISDAFSPLLGPKQYADEPYVQGSERIRITIYKLAVPTMLISRTKIKSN